MRTSVRPHHLEEAKYLRNHGLTWQEIAARLPYHVDTLRRAVMGGESQRITLSVKRNYRFTEAQAIAIKENGGNKWLRDLIDRAIAEA